MLANVVKSQLLPDSFHLSKQVRQWSWRKSVSQDFRELEIKMNTQRVGGRHRAGPGPAAEKEHRINPRDGEIVSFVFAVAFLPGGRWALWYSWYHHGRASPRAFLELRAKRGSLGWYLEYLNSDGLFGLPVFAGIHILCFPCPQHAVKAAGTAKISNINYISWYRFLSWVTPLKSTEHGIQDGFMSTEILLKRMILILQILFIWVGIGLFSCRDTPQTPALCHNIALLLSPNTSRSF